MIVFFISLKRKFLWIWRQKKDTCRILAYIILSILTHILSHILQKYKYFTVILGYFFVLKDKWLIHAIIHIFFQKTHRINTTFILDTLFLFFTAFERLRKIGRPHVKHNQYEALWWFENRKKMKLTCFRKISSGIKWNTCLLGSSISVFCRSHFLGYFLSSLQNYELYT